MKGLRKNLTKYMFAFGLKCRFRAHCGAHEGVGFQLCLCFQCASSDAVLDGALWALIEMIKMRAWRPLANNSGHWESPGLGLGGHRGGRWTQRCLRRGPGVTRPSEHTCLAHPSENHSEQRPVTLAARGLMGKTYTCPLQS